MCYIFLLQKPDFLITEGNLKGLNSFFQMIHFSATNYWGSNAFLGEKPCKCNLRRGYPLLFCYFNTPINHRPVTLSRVHKICNSIKSATTCLPFFSFLSFFFLYLLMNLWLVETKGVSQYLGQYKEDSFHALLLYK